MCESIKNGWSERWKCHFFSETWRLSGNKLFYLFSLQLFWPFTPRSQRDPQPQTRPQKTSLQIDRYSLNPWPTRLFLWEGTPFWDVWWNTYKIIRYNNAIDEQLAPTSSQNVHKWISEGISLGCVSGFRVLRMKCQTLREKTFFVCLLFWTPASEKLNGHAFFSAWLGLTGPSRPGRYRWK